ncbi:PREDICTED: cathelicidin-2-like [Gekko japonicus]|uniref:Vipericidin n=1 Tax=Gekko japonicus TaxID=146911 RepID=A0ABM1KVU1_GEKJA|nr:PREDICTED: cathelicidin-2-like [Gekko japonicus]
MEGRILLMLGLAMAATALFPVPEELGYEEAVSLAIDLYNQEPGVAWAFRLLEAKPQPEWDPLMKALQPLEFTMQETTCPPSKPLNLDECDFKKDGVVKECSGTISPDKGAPGVDLDCETVGQGRTRVRRGFFKPYGKKPKKVAKKPYYHCGWKYCGWKYCGWKHCGWKY